MLLEDAAITKNSCSLFAVKPPLTLGVCVGGKSVVSTVGVEAEYWQRSIGQREISAAVGADESVRRVLVLISIRDPSTPSALNYCCCLRNPLM